LKKSSVFEWHKQFKEGCKNVVDDERSGQDLTVPLRMFKNCGIWSIQIDVEVLELWLCN